MAFIRPLHRNHRASRLKQRVATDLRPFWRNVGKRESWLLRNGRHIRARNRPRGDVKSDLPAILATKTEKRTA